MARRLLLCVGLCLMFGRPVAAQLVTGEPDPASVRVRLGPLYLNPTLSLTNMGIDTNVFNEPVEADPKRDFTLTVEPKTDLWLRMGPTWISGQIGEQVVWYQTYSTQRSSNARYQLGWLVPLNRLTLRANGSFVNTRERPGFEIDTRPQRRDRGLEGAVEFRLLAKTFFGVRGGKSDSRFEDEEFFRGRNLQTELNRTTTTMGLTVRNQLTPLTSLSMDVGRTEDRFEFSSLRDSDSTVVNAQLQFDPFALIKGGAKVGYRNFRPLAPGVPDFTGLTVASDLSYVLLGSTRFTVQVNRDVNYSFDVNQPYYVITGMNVSIAQQLFGPLDVVGRYGASRLAYRDRIGAAVEATNRVDHTKAYGGGFGYHLGRDLRIGVNIDESSRSSALDDRRYEGLKFGTAVTYGF